MIKHLLWKKCFLLSFRDISLSLKKPQNQNKSKNTIVATIGLAIVPTKVFLICTPALQHQEEYILFHQEPCVLLLVACTYGTSATHSFLLAQAVLPWLLKCVIQEIHYKRIKADL